MLTNVKYFSPCDRKNLAGGVEMGNQLMHGNLDRQVEEKRKPTHVSLGEPQHNAPFLYVHLILCGDLELTPPPPPLIKQYLQKSTNNLKSGGLLFAK